MKTMVSPSARGLEKELVVAGLIGNCCIGLGSNFKELKPFLLNQVLSNSMFARANA